MQQRFLQTRKLKVLVLEGHGGAVYDTLDQFGVTVAGGRSNIAGVGGFILKGGFSNSSPEHVFASDNVVNYEVVLPDGRIVNANATSEPALFKGASSDLSRFDIRAYLLTSNWDGETEERSS
ncbi:hypothetical protein ONZ45_g6492 [Pleurotus djamor]|nr:hypothetical protein ONZ45_g6492 [Pleurotus djamor]